jgi:hypothetical protein
MKKILVLLFIFVTVNVTHAQKNFQGEIIYKLHASAENKPDAELTVLFGTNKIKIRFKQNEEYEKDELQVSLDSGTTVTLNREQKTFRKKMLQFVIPSQRPDKKAILGYSSTPLIPEQNSLAALFGGLMSASSTVFFVADSLNYFIPEGYAGNMEFMMVQKNRIVLGAEIHFKENLYASTDSTNKNLVTAEAISIKPMPVNDEQFAIPADFINAADAVPTAAEADTTAPAVFESQFTPPALPKKTTTKKPVKSNKGKTPVKSSAVKRKE